MCIFIQFTLFEKFNLTLQIFNSYYLQDRTLGISSHAKGKFCIGFIWGIYRIIEKEKYTQEDILLGETQWVIGQVQELFTFVSWILKDGVPFELDLEKKFYVGR